MSNEKNKFIVKFNGGLGNQMFQRAFALALEKRTGVPAFMDMSFFEKKYARPYELNVFDTKIKTVDDFGTKFKLGLIWSLRKKLNGKKFLGLNFYSEPHFEYDENLFKLSPNTYIEGFFQSEKYFKNIEKEVRADFRFKNLPDEENQKLIEKIGTTNSISLHIRRGDYVKKKRYQNLYANCSLGYYKRGVDYIGGKYPNPTLFIFSDDIKWVKENFKLPYECVYVSHNTGSKSFEDMRLMSLCKHNIIANSSFSWWGAWLNNNKEKIVIAPKKWFNDEKIIQTDVIPENWVRIEN
ncbi:MAG: alpha-1,2-fucosyltransferase [Candidatus Gastranaerophilaceae bacterium]